MIDVLLDGLIDTLKLLPYLLITFLILEYIEHKLSKKNHKFKLNKENIIINGICNKCSERKY